jgi:hypothetical protein
MAMAVSPFLAWIGSPCLRLCVHGASIDGGEDGRLEMAAPELQLEVPPGGREPLSVHDPAQRCSIYGFLE